ncbi:MAG: hypothetical protein ACI835_000066 [Planctomycetota bacterium]|jgi:hypothetical protein
MGGGLIAITEDGPSGWRIRYNDTFLWNDGPGVTIAPSALDLQAIATHQYGCALGLAHSSTPGATMGPAAGPIVNIRSIAFDDSAGVQAIYGVASASKPNVSGVIISPTSIEILGSKLGPTANQVWFTRSSGSDRTHFFVSGLTSNGSSILVPIPIHARSGDLIKRTGNLGGESISNAWPIDLGTPCETPQAYCTGATNSVGAVAIIDHRGSVCIAARDLTIRASACPTSQTGVFYYGDKPIDVPFGDGRHCVGVAVQRLPVLLTSPTGDAIQTLDYSSPPLATGPGRIIPGAPGTSSFGITIRRRA